MTRTVTLSFVITSCGGTLSVTVRRSTRTIWSTIGIRKRRPGPLSAISRPSRKTTPRSYSRRIRIADAAISRTSTTSAPTTTNATISPLLPFRCRRPRSDRLRSSSRGSTTRVSPSIASTLTLYPASTGAAAGPTRAPRARPGRRPARSGRASSRTSPIEPISSSCPVGTGRCRARTALRRRRRSPGRARRRDADHQCRADLDLVAVGVEEQQAAADQRGDPGDAEQAAGRQVGLGDDQADPEDQQQDPDRGDRELDRADQRRAAERPRRSRPG